MPDAPKRLRAVFTLSAALALFAFDRGHVRRHITVGGVNLCRVRSHLVRQRVELTLEVGHSLFQRLTSATECFSFRPGAFSDRSQLFGQPFIEPTQLFACGSLFDHTLVERLLRCDELFFDRSWRRNLGGFRRCQQRLV